MGGYAGPKKVDCPIGCRCVNAMNETENMSVTDRAIRTMLELGQSMQSWNLNAYLMFEKMPL